MRLKSLLLVLALSLTVLAVAQAPQAAAPAQAPAAQKPQITDPAEYAAYAAAYNEKDPAKKAAALEAFLKKYPSTPVKEDALELWMSASAGAGNAAGVQEAARQLLQVNPRSLSALNMLVSVFIQTGVLPTDPALDQKLKDAEQWAKTGLEVLPSFAPAGASPEQLKAAKDLTAAMFHQALGLVGMGRKQFPAAQQEFTEAAKLSPTNMVVFYQLGQAYIFERPTPQYSKAFWAFARAAAYTGPGGLPEQSRKGILAYLRDDPKQQVYVKYHGSTEGLDALLAQAAQAPFPPDDFKILSASEVEAAKPVEAEKLDFYEIRDMLLGGTPKADELWSKLKGTTRTFKGVPISGTPEAKPKTLRIVVATDTAKKGGGAYDVELVLTTPITKLPADVIDFTGQVNAFSKEPFSLVMIDGKIAGGEPAAKKAPPATKRAPATKKAPAVKKAP
jgi:hypothetical protein